MDFDPVVITTVIVTDLVDAEPFMMTNSTGCQDPDHVL